MPPDGAMQSREPGAPGTVNPACRVVAGGEELGGGGVKDETKQQH